MIYHFIIDDFFGAVADIVHLPHPLHLIIGFELFGYASLFGKGKTVIMIAHRLSTVVGADKIIVLDGGRLVEEGTHEELKNNGGLYARMWDEYNQAAKCKIQSEVK